MLHRIPNTIRKGAKIGAAVGATALGLYGALLGLNLSGLLSMPASTGQKLSNFAIFGIIGLGIGALIGMVLGATVGVIIFAVSNRRANSSGS